MGGWAAAWFTVRNPEIVPACMLLAPSFDFLNCRWQQMSEPERRLWQETGRLRVRNKWVDTEIGYGLIAEAGRFPVEELASRWQTPLLICHGMRDEVIPYRLTLDFVERLAYPHVWVHLFKDGDHRLQTRENGLAQAAVDFFNETLSLDSRSR
jgi:pimeloyl-ACP methyl ester carboxylesterase